MDFSARRDRLKSLILPASFACMLWGSAAPVIKLGYSLLTVKDTWSMALFAGYRFMLAGIMVILYACVRRRKLCLPGKENWLRVCLLGFIMTFAQYLFNFIGVGHASGVNASIMNGSGSLLAILLACTAFRQEKMTARKAAGCIFGFGGILIMNIGGTSSGVSVMGEGFLFLAALCGGIGNCQCKRYAVYEDPVTLTGWQFLTGGLMLILTAGLCGGNVSFSSAGGTLCLIWLSSVSAAAYCIWNILFTRHPVSDLSVHGFLIPLFGVLIAAVLLGEYTQAFRPATLAALALVCLGIITVNLRGKKDSENVQQQ